MATNRSSVGHHTPNWSIVPPPQFFGEGQAPKFLDRDYKLEHSFRHGAKFRGNLPTDLGNPVTKKERSSSKALRLSLIVTGGLIINSCSASINIVTKVPRKQNRHLANKRFV